MSHPDIHLPLAFDADRTVLARIRGLCRLVRVAAVVYAAASIVGLIWLWSHDDAQLRAYGSWLGTAFVPVPPMQRLAGFAVKFVQWLLVAAACLAMIRLFGGFLAGRIFTLDAARLVRRIALFGLAAELVDVLTRPVISVLLTLHMAPGTRQIGLFLDGHDLLEPMFLIGFLALGHVFAVAAEIAADNAAIV